ncbi:MAG TPA: hypothetical protein VFY06_13160 [Verrucomicrobiae bacterium]|nr:hypothetical protein [Verrucomicrobiae bacterium]
MKLKRHMLTAAVLAGLAAGTLTVRADDQDVSKMSGMKMGDQAGQANAPAGNANAKVKPYPLDYCVVSGDKFDGDMGKPIVIVYKGQEMKFCCADCPKKFKKTLTNT